MLNYLRNHRMLRAIGRVSLSAIVGSIIVLVVKFVWKLVEDRIVTEANSQIDSAVEGVSMLDKLQQLSAWYFSNVTFLEAIIFPLIAILAVELFRLKQKVVSDSGKNSGTLSPQRVIALLRARENINSEKDRIITLGKNLLILENFKNDFSFSAHTQYDGWRYSLYNIEFSLRIIDPDFMKAPFDLSDMSQPEKLGVLGKEDMDIFPSPELKAKYNRVKYEVAGVESIINKALFEINKEIDRYWYLESDKQSKIKDSTETPSQQ